MVNIDDERDLKLGQYYISFVCVFLSRSSRRVPLFSSSGSFILPFPLPPPSLPLLSLLFLCSPSSFSVLHPLSLFSILFHRGITILTFQFHTRCLLLSRTRVLISVHRLTSRPFIEPFLLSLLARWTSHHVLVHVATETMITRACPTISMTYQFEAS